MRLGTPTERSREADPDHLVSGWRTLLATGEHLHAPEIASRLGVSEAALVAARIGSGALRLRPDIVALLAPIDKWGRVLCALSNRSGVTMPLGETALQVAADGLVRLTGAHLEAEIDAKAVSEAFLFVDRDEKHGATRSIQLFDGNGAPILKVFIFHKTRFSEAEARLHALAADDQSRQRAPGPTAPRHDLCAASLAADPNVAPASPLDPRAAIEAALGGGGRAEIEAIGRHARAIWRGTVAGLRFGDGMLHLHELGLRAHLRLAALAPPWRAESGALAFAETTLDGEARAVARGDRGAPGQARLLRIKLEESRCAS